MQLKIVFYVVLYGVLFLIKQVQCKLSNSVLPQHNGHILFWVIFSCLIAYFRSLVFWKQIGIHDSSDNLNEIIYGTKFLKKYFVNNIWVVDPVSILRSVVYLQCVVVSYAKYIDTV